jgi:DNA-binding NarL/FixJ family response regulator
VDGRVNLHPDLSTLTPRELDVLRLLAKGLSDAELTMRLQLSETTVKAHMTRILSKLNLRDRAQAIVVAYKTGLITPGAAHSSET